MTNDEPMDPIQKAFYQRRNGQITLDDLRTVVESRVSELEGLILANERVVAEMRKDHPAHLQAINRVAALERFIYQWCDPCHMDQEALAVLSKIVRKYGPSDHGKAPF